MVLLLLRDVKLMDAKFVYQPVRTRQKNFYLDYSAYTVLSNLKFISNIRSALLHSWNLLDLQPLPASVL